MTAAYLAGDAGTMGAAGPARRCQGPARRAGARVAGLEWEAIVKLAARLPLVRGHGLSS